jgi:hypothetical protein
MKAIHWTIAAAALAFVQPAQAGVNDPEIILYRFPGVLDGFGSATVFHCTNFSGVMENIRFVTRLSGGSLASNHVVSAPHLVTTTASTRLVAAYINELDLQVGGVAQGTTAIAATSINIICTAETIDAAAATPIGVARRGIRFSPVPGSQE